jgi:hydroxyacylglutathione hydrolase
MLFKRFYDDNLAQASYLVACERTREGIVVDPNIDIGQYTRAASAERIRITHVTETHIHADFVSGARALADATGAKLHLSSEGGKEWGYTSDALAHANALRDGSEISFGTVRLRVAHTPGHTPEHLAFFVSDLDRGQEPVGALTGDFIFVGDVGRPDLLERAAGARGSMERSAAELHRSIRQFLAQPDHLQIWPGHGAGSACGKSLGSMPQSTLGYEKLFNWALSETSEREFVRRVLEDQPFPPRYFAVMKKINRVGAAPADQFAPRELELAGLDAALESGAAIVDTRSAVSFASGHVPGTLNIPRNKSFLNWLGALVSEDAELYLITGADGEGALELLFSDLSKIGFNSPRGYFRSSVVDEWKGRHGELEKIRQLDAAQVKKAKDGDNPRGGRNLQIVDVRGPDEWRRGHLPGAIHIPLASLPDRLGELDSSAPIILQCKGGGRSAIATSFLQSHGIANATNMVGGYESWVKNGFEVSVDEPVADARSPRK